MIKLAHMNKMVIGPAQEYVAVRLPVWLLVSFIALLPVKSTDTMCGAGLVLSCLLWLLT